MEKCLICACEFPREGNNCPRCHWPLGFSSITRNPHIDADVVNWAAHMYKQLLKMHERHQGASTTGNVRAENTPNPTDISVLEGRVQQLTTELHNLNSTYIQERHRNNRKLEELTKEIEFFKDVIQKDRAAIAKITALEKQFREISQFIVIPQPPAVPFAVATDNMVITEAPETVRDWPISLPSFDNIADRTTQNPLTDIKIPISPAERDLLDLYNRFADIPEAIRQGAIDVSIDADAINRLRDGDMSPVTFVVDRKGNFLIVRCGGYQYLIPNKKRPINSHIHKTVKSIYTCEGYYESYEQFTLIRPALVEEVPGSTVTSREDSRWQLSQKGVLKFK
jgi:hypothetical protein